MPPIPPQLPPTPPDEGIEFASFSGLKNTVSPERLTAKQMSRAQNIDLDDLGQVHRRRGRELKVTGRWHSLFTTEARPKRTFGVRDGALVLVNPDYSTVTLLAGIADDPLAYVEVGPTIYFSSIHNSGQIDLLTLVVSPWGRVVSPSYQPGLAPGPADFWFSPVANPEDTLGAVGGRLLGAPPLGSHLAYHNGRIYIADGNTLWATELYLYNYVDKNKNYRMFEAPITGLCAVEDGVYVGTAQALYFLAGMFGEHIRTMRERSGVLPGSMVPVPGELIDPEARRFPDIPRQTSKGMACMTTDGVVAGLAGGNTFNLTRTEFIFPKAVRSTTMFRQEDGMNTLVTALESGGTPAENARFGDYLSAQLIRATATPGQPGSPPSDPLPQPTTTDPTILLDLAGTVIGEIP